MTPGDSMEESRKVEKVETRLSQTIVSIAIKSESRKRQIKSIKLRMSKPDFLDFISQLGESREHKLV